MDNDFEEGNCEEMPDLNITGSAVQPYMFEPTKGTEGEKSASGSEENSDSDDDLEISHGSDANEFELLYKNLKKISATTRWSIIYSYVYIFIGSGCNRVV